MLIKTLASAEQEDFYRLLCSVLSQHYDVKLFTLTLVDFDNARVQRLYSSHPHIYPIGGFKPFPENFWTEQVVKRKELFIANTPEAIKDVFFDHKVIQSLNLGSVINYPVCVNNKVVGTVNILSHENAYKGCDVTHLKNLYPWLVIAFLYQG